MNDSTSPQATSLWLQVVLFTLTRLIIDTNYRMVYPYLSTFQTGLGVSLTSISLLLTIRAMTGFIGPLFAPLADWRGRRLSMLLGISGFTLGALIVVIYPTFPTFFIASVLMATSGLIYVPAMQAFISDRVPFERRGRIIGATELSWSLSFFIGVPLVGWLLAGTGNWFSPFILYAALGLIFLFVLFRIIPRDNLKPSAQTAKTGRGDLLRALRTPGLIIGLAMSFMMTSANESVNIIFGLWLEGSFKLQLTALGAASVVIGIAELGGGGLSTWIVDRLGKQRAVGTGLLLNCLAAGLLILFGNTLTGALIGLFAFYLTFEFALVSTISMMSEAVPAMRATVIATTVSCFAIGRAFSSAFGPFVFSSWGFPVNAVVAVIFNLIALVLLTRLKIDQNQSKQAVQPS
jgi:predicted MFS family arabinose efflux permease